jgi:pheromone shutdown-related protein TraB
MASISIIGTSHVSSESVKEVEQAIEHGADIVAVELDAQRAHALMHNQKSKITPGMIRNVGFKGFLFLAVASFLQKKIGRLIGVQPGAEMKAALRAAQRKGAKIALIDRDITITLRRLSNAFGWKERFRFIRDALSGRLANTELAEFKKMDLRKVPSKKLISAVLGRMKRDYPSLYRVLVEERNRHMAAALLHIANENPEAHIVAVVGAGHEEGIQQILADKRRI